MLSSVLLLLSLASMSKCCVYEKPTQPVQLMYQVSVRHKGLNNKHLCTGYLYHPYYVVTVAQCFTSLRWELGDLAVDIGFTWPVHDTRNFHHKSVPVREVVLHPDNVVEHNDIALVILSSPIDYSPTTGRIELPHSYESLKEGYPLTKVSGFVRHTSHQVENTELMGRELQYDENHIAVLGLKFCEEAFKIPNTQICAYDPCERGNCSDNLGGGLIVNGRLVGLLSRPRANRCLPEDFPVVFTRVSKYSNWIEEEIARRERVMETCPPGCHLYVDPSE